MKYSLTLHEEGWSREGQVFGIGPVNMYRVGGMPEGEEARITNFGAPHRDDWRIMRIKRDTQSKWTGSYKSADVALAVLQKEFE